MQKPKLVYTTFIRTTPKKLWAAITKPEFTRQYWAGIENVSDWKKGSKWEHIGGGEKREVWITGKVLESNPLKRLVLSRGDWRPGLPDGNARELQGRFGHGWQSFLGLAARAFEPEILSGNRQGSQRLRSLINVESLNK